MLVGDVVVRQVRAPVGQEPRLGLDLARLALQRRHRLLQQLHVQIEPQAHDEPALLGPQQVAGAADLQVLERDLEPHTQVVELLDHPQPLLRLLGQHPPRRHEQVSECPVRGAPHAAAQLIELGQAERVGPVDDQRVHARDVQARLDDHRRHQHVGLLVDEVEHHSLQLVLVHLAVRHRDAHLRHELLHAQRHVVNGLDAVVDEEHLAASVDLAQDGVRHHLLVVLQDLGVHRQPIAGWRLDHRHVAGAGETQVQRARDRCGGQRQHVHRARQLPHALLLRHAEPMFLVDDHQAEILEFHLALQQALRRDHDVHRARRHAALHALGLLVAAKS